MDSAVLVLVIAGSDPLAFSGLQADLRHLAGRGCVARAVPTCLTVQGASSVESITRLEVAPTLAAVELALQAPPRPGAVKIGLVHDPELAAGLGELLGRCSVPVVLDPVLAAGAGDSLWRGDGIAALRDHLLPRAYVVTPNLDELASLCGRELSSIEDRAEAARDLMTAGCRRVLVKGGHDAGNPDLVSDLLFVGDQVPLPFASPRIAGASVRGTGCALSTLMAAGLARGVRLEDAVGAARELVIQGMAAAVARGSRQLVVPVRDG